MARVDDDPFADIGKAVEDPFADIGAPSPLGREVARQGLDVLKQLPSGLVAGVEAIPTFPGQAASLLGSTLGPYVEKGVEALPSWMGGGPERAQAMREEAQRRREGAAAIQAQRRSVASYLPEPESRLGQVARTATEFIPSVVGGSKTLSIPRALGVGATTGITSELAGQATEGTAAEPYARIGGALVAGTAAARAAESAAAKAALPTIKETKAAGAELYDQFRASGFQLRPEAAPIFADSLTPAMARQGLTPETAEKTFKVVDKLRTIDPRKPFDPQRLHEAYQELGQVARSAGANEAERLAAGIAQENLLRFVENIDPKLVTGGRQGVAYVGPGGQAAFSQAPDEAVRLLREANQTWAAAKRAENVSGRITKAEQVASGQYSGLGLENELRRRIGIMGLPPEAAPRGAQRGFSPEELRRFQQFGEGTTGQNIRRYLTGALAGRGGFAVGGLGAGGLATYLGTGDPFTSGAIGIGAPAAGLTLAMLGNRSALARARDIERMLLARAPLAAGRIPRAQPSLPLTTAAPTLATLGELQTTEEGYPYYQAR